MKQILTLIFLTLFIFAKDIKVVFVQDDMANDFRKAQVAEVEKYIKDIDNIDFSYKDANGQLSMFIYQLEKSIKSSDIIIIGTPDANAINPALKKAHQKGVKTIILDRGVNSDIYTTFINSDNIEIGKIGAEYIVKELQGKGSVLLLEGLLQADVTQLRTKGFLDIVSKYPNIKVIRRVGNYLRKDAIIETERLLDNNITFDAIFSQSDSMLSGVRSVFENRDLNISRIISVGCDYTNQAKEAIKKGTQMASIKFPLGGEMSVKIIKYIIAKKKIDKHIVIGVELITKDNVDRVEPIF